MQMCVDEYVILLSAGFAGGLPLLLVRLEVLQEEEAQR